MILVGENRREVKGEMVCDKVKVEIPDEKFLKSGRKRVFCSICNWSTYPECTKECKAFRQMLVAEQMDKEGLDY